MAEDEGALQRGEAFDFYRDVLEPNHEEFWQIWDTKRDALEEGIKAIDEDFFDCFLGDDREIEMGVSSWNALNSEGRKKIEDVMGQDPELKAWIDQKRGRS